MMSSLQTSVERPSFIETQSSSEAPQAFSYLEYYSALCGDNERSDLRDHALRTKEIVHVFANNIIAPRTYDAVVLHDVADRCMTQSDSAKASIAAQVLADYFTSPDLSEKDSTLIACILGDMVYVEQMAQKYQDAFATTVANPTLKLALQDSYAGPIPSQLWHLEEPMVDVPHLKEVAETTNIESIIFKAAELLDNLNNPPSSEASVLRDILEIETFYAPLCEVLGLDAFAMKLRSETGKQRLRRGGDTRIVEIAEAMNAEANALTPIAALSQIFGRAPKSTVYEVEDTSPHPESISYGVALLSEVCSDGTEGTVHYRIKSIGSLAKKLSRDDRLPMDILGVTIVLEDTTNLGVYFSTMISRLKANEAVKFRPAPSKESAVYMQGSADYIEAIQSVLHEEHIDEAQIKIIDNDPDSIYQVCKTTFLLNGHLPVEIQFMTADEKRKGRVGRTAHILFKQQSASTQKSGHVDELVELLESIHNRIKLIDVRGETVNERSLAHGDALLEAIARNL